MCPGDICPYEEYLSCYRLNFDQTLKVDSKKFVGFLFLESEHCTQNFCTQNLLDSKNFWTPNFSGPKVLLDLYFFNLNFLDQNFLGPNVFLYPNFWIVFLIKSFWTYFFSTKTITTITTTTPPMGFDTIEINLVFIQGAWELFSDPLACLNHPKKCLYCPCYYREVIIFKVVSPV